jgi:hypothetical protein
MKDTMLADLPIEERGQILRDSCDQIEERHYTRKFNQDETNGRREELADVSIQIAEIETEFKTVKDGFRLKLKPLAEEKGKLLQELKTGGEYIKGEVYKFVDAEEGKVAWYTSEGYKLEERDQRPDERQRSLFQEIRIVNQL